MSTSFPAAESSQQLTESEGICVFITEAVAVILQTQVVSQNIQAHLAHLTPS